MKPFEVFDLRVAIRENGYYPVPAQGKDAYLEGWQIKRDITREEMASWSTDHPKWSNTGTQTGPTPAFDVDITHPEAAAAVGDLVRDWFDDKGTILTRYGEAPKFAILFRTEQPFEKIRVDFIDPVTIDPTKPKQGWHHIEVLGDGQQIIIDGIHPRTGKPYAWHANRSPANVPRSDLPETNEAEMRELVKLASDLLCERFGFKLAPTNPKSTGDGSTDATPGEHAPVDADNELANIHYGNINDTWGRVMGSELRNGTPADDVYRRILTATQNSPACQSDPNRGKWTSSLADMMTRYVRDNREFVLNLSPHVQINWHQLLLQEKRPKLKWRSDLGELGQLYVEKSRSTEAAGQSDQQGESNASGCADQATAGDPPKDGAEHAVPTGWHLYDGSKVEQPKWLIKGLLPESGVGIIPGQWGGYKTTTALSMGLSVMTGQPFADHYQSSV